MLIDDTSSSCGDGQKTHTHFQVFVLRLSPANRFGVFQEICRVT